MSDDDLRRDPSGWLATAANLRKAADEAQWEADLLRRMAARAERWGTGE